MTKTKSIIDLTERFGTRDYDSLPIVVERAAGVWFWDPEGKQYMDMLSAYSAVNQGHRHPRIIKALKDQADRVTVTGRSFHNDQLGEFYRRVSNLTGKDMVLPMNTGVEAVESALKAVRRWAYRVKGIPDNEAEIIVCDGNFHGRTITVISFSSEPSYREGFGPLTPGFKMIPYGDIDALRSAITDRTAALLIEPIQGEAGIRIPPPGFLRQASELCREHRVLFMADEIQTGLGRTGRMFACEWEDVVPDVYLLGKALGGGVYPVSVVAADREILSVFEPASHGSTFGGNPLAAAVGCAAIDVTVSEGLADRALDMGEKFMAGLKEMKNPAITEVRGQGLLIGVELNGNARPYCEQLMMAGVLAKETHVNVIRFAPPLVITDEELSEGLDRIRSVLG